MIRVIRGEFFGCLLLVADAFGFHPVRPKWHRWTAAAREYEKLPEESLGWWIGAQTIELVTVEEAASMGEALQSALAGGAPESGARALVNPNLPLCLEKFHTRDGRVAAQDIVDVCREGGFSIQTEDSGQLVVLTNVL